jgi:gluconolactonase
MLPAFRIAYLTVKPILLCLVSLTLFAQQRQVTITPISGVVSADAKWTLVWQGTDNADGIIASPDGGLLFAKEQPSRIDKLDRSNKVSVYLEDTHGGGALTIDSKGRLFAVERTCTDPGRSPQSCTEPTKVAQLAPERRAIADNIDGKSLGRLNDLIADKIGGFYFNGTGMYYVNAAGKVSAIGENIRTNGITLSKDEKTLYVTNGATIVAFDIQPDGSVKNQREFAKLEAGGAGDGMALDNEGRLYVTTQPGVQIISPQGKYIGLIPTPRPVISAAFSGADKKTLYVVGAGALNADGTEFQTPTGVRNNAKSIYRVPVLTPGTSTRVK